MKKTMLLVLIINIFLLMSVDVLNEYNSMKRKTQNLESSMRNSLNASIDTALSAEEFFADDTSYLSKSDSTAQISVWNGSGFTVGNLYVISSFMEERGYVPNQGAYDSYARSLGNIESFVYGKLFGNISSRQPTSKFRDFYNNVANLCSTTMRVKTNGAGYSMKTFPTLARMGLRLDSSWNSSTVPYSIGSSNQFTSPVNVGRNGSSYYLTPSSLGVTYLDETLLRNVMYCILDTQIRCNKASNVSDFNDLASADEFMATQVYENGVSGGYATQRNGAGHDVLTDGQVQYFMDTLDVNVTYYVVDWWDNANWQIVNYVEGTPTGVNPRELPSVLRVKSTQINKGDSYYVVVAKVDASILVSLPYNSWVLQWNRHRTSSGSSTEYYGVLDFDAGGSLETSDDGLLYKYTTFCAVTE